MAGCYPEGWRVASYSGEMVPESIRNAAVPGQVYRNPQTGHTLQKQANGRWKLTGGNDRMEKPNNTSPSPGPDALKVKKPNAELPKAKQPAEPQQTREDTKEALEEINKNPRYGPGNKKAISKIIQTLSNSLTDKDKVSWQDSDRSGILLKVESSTSHGDAVNISYSPSLGFSFKINNSQDAGSVTDRKAQIDAAFTVRRIFKGLIKALPEGSVIKAAAHTQDGKGEGRTNAYVAVGFSRPRKLGGNMFSIKMPDGSMKPATEKAYRAQKESDEIYMSFFSESGSSEGDEEHWYHILFG
jgi:hypothetical protein